MTRRWVRTFYTHTHTHVHSGFSKVAIDFIYKVIFGCWTEKCVDGKGAVCVCDAYLRSDLCSLLGIHHADVFEVFEGVLPVLLLGTHVLLQQAEDMARLQKTDS